METLKKPTEEVINRFLETRNGDPSFFVLACYSLIESYIRYNFPKKFKFSTSKALNFESETNTNSFPKMLDELCRYYNDNFISYPEFEKKNGSNKSNQKKQYKKRLNDFEKTINSLQCLKRRTADAVRHDFWKLDNTDIDAVIMHFKDFARHEKFINQRIDNIPSFAGWEKCKATESSTITTLMNNLNQITEAHKKDQKELETMTLKLEEERKKNQDLERKKGYLKEQKSKIDKKCDELRQKRFDLEEEIKKIKKSNASPQDIKKIKKELDEVIKQKDEQESLLTKKQEEINSLTKENFTLKEANDLFKKEKEDLTKSLKNIEKERMSIQKEIQSLKTQAEKNSETEQQLVNLTNEYNKVLLKKEEQENLLLKKQKEIDSLNKSYEDLAFMNKSLTIQKEEAEKKLKNAVSNSEQLLSKIRELEKNPVPDQGHVHELEKLKKDYEELQKQQEDQRKILKSIQEEYQRDIEKLKEDAEVYLENVNILQAYTSANRNYHSRILKLSPEQNAIIEDIYQKITEHSEENTNYLIKGGPGTGKTLVLIKILEKLITNEPSKKIELLTYTDSLSKYNQYLSEEYVQKSSKNKKSNINVLNHHIKTFDHYFKPLISEILGKQIYQIDQKVDNYKETEGYQKLLSIFKATIAEQDFVETILKEALNEIWVFCPTKEQYIDRSYEGIGAKLTPEQQENRKIVWNYVMKVTAELNKQQELPMEFAYYKIATNNDYSILPDKYKLDYLLIDEIQDLSPSRIRCFSKLNKYACVMAGDLNQSVFIKRQLSWIELGMKFSNHKNDPHIKKLTNNYRSTIPIQELANEYRRICKIKDDNAVSVSFIPGQKPEFSISKTLEESFENIILKIKCYLEVMSFNQSDICVVVPTDTDLIRIKGLLSDNHFNALKIDDPNFDFKKSYDTIRLSTTKMVKGIDSPVIILLLTEDFLDPTKNGNTDEMSQMNSIYSCITRTMDILSIQVTQAALETKLDSTGENAITKLYNIWKTSR